MSGPSRTPEEQNSFLTEQIRHLMEERIARAYSERQKALLPFSKLTPDEITDILLRCARERLAGMATRLFALVCTPELLESSLQQFNIDCREVDAELSGLTSLVLAVSNQSVANVFVYRFRMLIREEFEAWKAQGHRYLFEYNQFSQELRLAASSASRDQSRRNDPRQQLMEYFESRLAAPPLSLNGSSPALSLNSSSPGPLIELSHHAVIDVIDTAPSLQRQGSNGEENPAKLNACESTNRKTGPKPDGETHERVSRIVKTIAVDVHWTDKLPEISAALDSEQIRFSPDWAKCGYTSWSDCFRRGDRLVEKAIRYHLAWVKENSGPTLGEKNFGNLDNSSQL